jgi:hypothetical protein
VEGDAGVERADEAGISVGGVDPVLGEPEGEAGEREIAASG